jgi:hypothetical protein
MLDRRGERNRALRPWIGLGSGVRTHLVLDCSGKREDQIARYREVGIGGLNAEGILRLRFDDLDTILAISC